ncbi:hypothetical protein K505DRAFT_328462 [Melanomma pulvis-pyrius CBS 109.77]|uniref:Uncharacterized protein n=1 Tax=Melanomma pulvis-pyrius CBS 109.77 TaxID=1314802 RepID=A0A6A6WZK0_9PLEO|nr:hypothetical protein K505DRAFT_328462 [Melanomma pulvis-pyrius CBS 109.77]
MMVTTGRRFRTIPTPLGEHARLAREMAPQQHLRRGGSRQREAETRALTTARYERSAGPSPSKRRDVRKSPELHARGFSYAEIR